MRNLSAQLPLSPIRLVYGSAGRPTAAVLTNSEVLIDYKLFWIACETLEEAHYLAAIINSDTLYGAVKPLMSKGQYGARDLQKHLWRLDIPLYDSSDASHAALAAAGARATKRAAQQLDKLRASRAANKKPLTANIARRELREWLSRSKTGKQIEILVGKLNF